MLGEISKRAAEHSFPQCDPAAAQAQQYEQDENDQEAGKGRPLYPAEQRRQKECRYCYSNRGERQSDGKISALFQKTHIQKRCNDQFQSVTKSS